LVVAAGLTAGCGGDKGSGQVASSDRPPIRCKPATGDTVRLKGAWKPGERRSITIYKTKDGTTSSTPGEIRVLAVKGGGWKLRFVSGETALPESLGDEAQESAKQLLERLGQLTIDYSTDADGAIQSIDNRSEVRRYMERVANVLAQDATTAEEKEAFAKTRDLITSDTFIESTLNDNVGLVHYGYGPELAEGRAVNVKTELPNPFGGSAIPAKLRATLVQKTDSAGCARVQYVTTADEKDVAEAFAPAMSKLAGKTVSPSQLRGVSIKQTIRLTFDPGTGWMTRSEAIKETSTGDKATIEKTLITLR
jgi:hypothetical protein